MEYNIYIGYDKNEHIAAEVCKFSLLQHMADDPVRIKTTPIHYLKSEDIPEYVRPHEATQSTDFTYTRFMIPYMNKYKGFSVFCDCDFLFVEDIYYLMDSIDKTKAVSVVKHPPYIPRTETKMYGIDQHIMQKKNWASLIVFNNEHPANKHLTPEYVNTRMPGRQMHQFEWCAPYEIGSIPLNWNTLDDYYLLDNPKAIHYTDGGPWFDDYKKTMYSDYWWKAYYDYTNATGQQRTLSPDA